MTANIYSWKEWQGRASIQEMVELWNKTMGELFPLSEALFARNVFHPLYLDLSRSCLVIEDNKLIGYLVAKSDPYQVLHHPQSLWLSCLVVHPNYQRKGHGTDMLKHALKNEKTNVLVGSDPHHFFPGIPSKLTAAQAFFQKQGFTLDGKAYDLRCDISKHCYATPPMTETYVVKRLLPKHQGELLQHMIENYSTRRYKETEWSLIYEKDITTLVGLFHNDILIGFAHVHSKGDSFWIPSVYWEKDDNPNIGGLGPVGIHKKYRGTGIGTFFMIETLRLLQKEGIKEMGIDWTILIDFYKKFYFRPHRSYIHASLTKP
ncbi:GNAT family N-acetyltransferase [Bacillus sp. JCM 19034]|uniref:GNAT family N-acetyltransferase n=1 Tax=Bacillus sp. JCM 19034 TaxID=1481928 RepID=UPI0007816CFD|nr:GNAT family N-acetyltransferase [Bacillus sp. JCM 19034]